MNENREEYCFRIGGLVYIRTDKPCPECGMLDAHVPKSELRDRLDRALELCNHYGKQAYGFDKIAAILTGEDQ